MVQLARLEERLAAAEAARADRIIQKSCRWAYRLSA